MRVKEYCIEVVLKINKEVYEKVFKVNSYGVKVEEFNKLFVDTVVSVVSKYLDDLIDIEDMQIEYDVLFRKPNEFFDPIKEIVISDVIKIRAYCNDTWKVHNTGEIHFRYTTRPHLCRTSLINGIEIEEE